MTIESLNDELINAIVERLIDELPMDRLASLVVEKLPLDRLVRLVASRMGAGAPIPLLSETSGGAIMEPFFERSETSQAILRLLPLAHKRKWTVFFADWGCLRCQRGENAGFGHSSNGLCTECYPRIARWLRESIKKRVGDGATITAEEAIFRHRRQPLTADDLDRLTPDTIMEPWFLDKRTESAIAQLVPISKRRKWIYFFIDRGCLRCGRTDRKHHCLGLCKRCYLWAHYHLGTSIKRHIDQSGPTPEDLTARLALRATTAQRIFAGEEVVPLPPLPEPATDPMSLYDVWKKRLGRGCAQMIDALTNRGELSTEEIANITGLTPRTVQDDLIVLRRNTLVESQNGRHVLRKPCEDCRQLRQALFRERKKSKHHAGKYLASLPPPAEEG